ncbi:hypothetical protein KIPB_006851 [Kipferlia bialata]|uniref:Uncharacterized protein n=1 Tax=Kipferlia bialata TaxID=797122 RepID=A0A9K3GK27_9EUKA|nr:hypothetical protein KIPB_006851 [Kipferlia bialata]|eukprot:g6851.t1
MDYPLRVHVGAFLESMGIPNVVPIVSVAEVGQVHPAAERVATEFREGLELAVEEGRSEVYLKRDLQRVQVNRSTLESELYLTAPSSRVQGVIFPNGYGRVFATYCKNYISVWGTDSCEELLRVVIPATDCLSATFSPDGRQILSGWSDGTIRSFGPQSGKLLFAIPEAHQGGINCLAMATDSVTLFSGGRDGLLKRWRVTPTSQQLQQVYPEHRGAINSLALTADGVEVMSAGSDGSVLTWNVQEAVREVAIRDSTSFVNAVYGADEAHVVTAGSNGMLSWWGATSGSAIRRLDVSEATPLSALCISENTLLVGTDDGLVRAIDYDSGEAESTVQGHSAAVSGLVFSPEDGICVSVSEDMGVRIWALVDREED